MKHKISVIIPVYNVETYLPRCLDSVINQSYKDLEIILVNDGSQDNSGQICDSYAVKDQRIVVIHKENEGSSCARNVGLDSAKGDFIAFVDSDDYIHHAMFDVMLTHLLEHQLDIVEIRPNYKGSEVPHLDDFEIQDHVVALQRIIEQTTFNVWCRLYRKTLIEDLRFIPKIIHQDVFFTIDVLNRIDKIGFLNLPLYYYNSDNESIIRSTYSLRKITAGIRATEYLTQNLAQHSALKNTLKNYVTYYYTDHYFSLSRHTEIDGDKAFRKKLRKAIMDSFTFKTMNLRSLMVILFPSKVMELVSTSYNKLTSR